MKKFKIKRNLKGFTLVELIIVITILAILATIAFISFGNYASGARDSVRLSDINSIQKGLELGKVKTGLYPDPDSTVIYTGGTTTLKQGVFGDNISKNVSLSSTPIDPLDKSNYVYSTTDNGQYYQIAFNKESDEVSLIPQAYADFTSASVKGNYTFDPSLPSLIVVPSSVNSASGIFDPNVCFVLDNGKNTLSSCVEKKSDMSLKDFDNSLVGYWDMETYYQTIYSGTNNVVFLKDLSGNNYDMSLSNDIGLKNNITTSSGDIFTGTLNGKGVIFDNSNFKLGFGTIPLGKNFTYNLRNITNVSGNIFSEDKTQTGGKIIPGMSSSILFDYDSNLGKNWGVKRMVSWNLNNLNNKEYTDFLKLIDGGFMRFEGEKLHIFIAPYNDGVGINQYSGLNGCGNNNGNIEFNDSCGVKYKHFQNIINGKNIMVSNIFFDKKEQCIFLNGKNIGCMIIDDSTINRIQEKGYTTGGFGISSGSESFAGIIDDVKIYNRALSDEEIAQQAKIAGLYGK